MALYDCEHSETNRQNPPYRYQDSEMNSIPDNDRDHFNLRNPTCDNVQDTNHVDNRSVMVTGHGELSIECLPLLLYTTWHYLLLPDT